MFTIRVTPGKTRSILDAQSRPGPGQAEVVPWCMYDTQTFTTAATLNLQYFTVDGANPSLSNLRDSGFQNGMFQADNYFELHWITCDILAIPTDTAGSSVVGPIDDIDRLLKAGGGGRFAIQYDNKPYGPFPIRSCHAMGGVTGYGFGAAAAANLYQYANNGILGSGGFPFLGNLVIRPQTQFTFALTWPATVVVNANPLIQIGLWGVRYRNVV